MAESFLFLLIPQDISGSVARSVQSDIPDTLIRTVSWMQV